MSGPLDGQKGVNALIQRLTQAATGRFLSMSRGVSERTAKFEAEEILQEVAETYFETDINQREALMRALLSP